MICNKGWTMLRLVCKPSQRAKISLLPLIRTHPIKLRKCNLIVGVGYRILELKGICSPKGTRTCPVTHPLSGTAKNSCMMGRIFKMMSMTFVCWCYFCDGYVAWHKGDYPNGLNLIPKSSLKAVHFFLQLGAGEDVRKTEIQGSFDRRAILCCRDGGGLVEGSFNVMI